MLLTDECFLFLATLLVPQSLAGHDGTVPGFFLTAGTVAMALTFTPSTILVTSPCTFLVTSPALPSTPGSLLNSYNVKII